MFAKVVFFRPSFPFAFLAFSLVSVLSAADWPQWRGPNRDGTTPEKGWYSSWPPKRIWSVQVGEGFSSAVVAAGRLFTLGHTRTEKSRGKDEIFCLDAETGKEIWRYSYDCQSSKRDRVAEYFGPRATPLVDEGRVYTAALDGQFYCLDVEKGGVIYQKDLKKYSLGDMMYGFCSSPLIYKDTLLYNVKNACMAFEKKTGKPIWRCHGGEGIYNGVSPVIYHAKGSDWVIFGEKSLIAADLGKMGAKLWEYPMSRISVSAPLFSGDLIFFSTYPNKGRCEVFKVGQNKLEPVWTHSEIQVYHVGHPVLWKGFLFGLDSNKTEFSSKDTKLAALKCLDFQTGKVLWTQPGMGWSQLIASDDRILVQRETGELLLIEASPKEYRELGRAQALDGPCWAVPALAGGRIFCKNRKGEVVGLEAK